MQYRIFVSLSRSSISIRNHFSALSALPSLHRSYSKKAATATAASSKQQQQQQQAAQPKAQQPQPHQQHKQDAEPVSQAERDFQRELSVQFGTKGALNAQETKSMEDWLEEPINTVAEIRELLQEASAFIEAEDLASTQDRIGSALDLESMGNEGMDQGRMLLSIVTDMLKKDSKSLPLFMVRAWVALMVEHPRQALADFRYVLDALEPSIVMQQFALRGSGMAHAMMGDMDAALDMMNQAIELQPSDIASLLDRATLYREMECYEDALREMDKIIGIYEQTANALRNTPLGSSQSSAIDPSLLLQRAQLHGYLGHVKEAVEDYNLVLRHHHRNVDAYMGRGFLLMNQDEDLDLVKEAIKDFTRVIQVLEKDDEHYRENDQYIEALTWRGACFVTLKEKEAALVDLSEALSLNPDYEDALEIRAGVYSEMGKQKSAEKDLARLAELRQEEEQAELEDEQQEADQEAFEEEEVDLTTGKVPKRE